MQNKKKLWLLVVIALVFQIIAPINIVSAITDEIPQNQINVTKANLKIMDGDTEILPTGGVYENVPTSAKIQIEYAFKLLDDDGGSTEYHYHAGQTHTIALPTGIVFSVPSGGIPIKDASNTEMGVVTYSGSSIVVTFNSYVDDSSSNSDMGCSFAINGSFDSNITNNPSPAPITFTFAGKAITINFHQEPPPPPDPDLVIDTYKSGVYDAQSNIITWTVKVKPTNATGKNISVEDVYSNNQEYVSNSFTVDGVPTSADLVFDTSAHKLTYVFPGDIGIGVEKVITYQTIPLLNAFYSEDSGRENVDFVNTATIKTGTNVKGTVAAKVALNWIQKSGQVDSSNYKLIHWTINFNNDPLFEDSKHSSTTTNLSITNPVITDTIPTGLDLVGETVKINGVPVTTDSSLGLPDLYTYVANTLTYSHTGTLTGPQVLTFDTLVSDINADLNQNGGKVYYNTANITWDENTYYGAPSDGIGVGVGLSVIAKSAGNKISFEKDKTDVITWTIYVNRNKIDMVNPIVTDDFPLGVEYVNNSFDINDKTGESFNGTLTTTESGLRYDFGSRTINSTYIITFRTKVTDYSKFFSNSISGGVINFPNTAKLLSSSVGGGVQTSSPATQAFDSEIIKKTVQTQYNYITRRVKWNITVNKNKIPLTKAEINDVVPVGMKFINGSFEVRDHSGNIVTTSAGTLTYLNKEDSDTVGNDTFQYIFNGISDCETYNISYETEMKESYLKTNQFSSQNFTNTASISNYGKTVSSSAIQVIRNPIVKKTSQYITGADSIDWVVPINTGMVSWAGITLTDHLQNELELDVDTVKLYEMALNADGTLTKVNPLSPLPNTAYSVAYNSKIFTLTLNGPVTGVYQLEFTTDVLTESATIKNSITFQGSAFSAGSTANTVIVNLNDSSAVGYSKRGQISIIKEDADDSSKKLSGAEFSLYDINKQLITTKTTNIDGKADFTSLKFRTFYIGETKAPDGYLLNTQLQKVKINSEIPYVITFKNQKATAKIEFQKQSAGGQPLGGAEFTLYNKGDGTAIKTALSDSLGKVLFSDIPKGEYYIKETKAPSGYYSSSDTIQASVDTNVDKTGMTVTLSKNVIKNNPIPGVSFGDLVLTKKDENGKLLPGAQFVLLNASGTIIQSGITQNDGKLRFNNLVAGQYTIRETAAPEGYELNKNDYSVNVTTGDTKELTVVNNTKKQYGTIEVLKNDEAGNPLEGAEFTLFDNAGKVVAKSITDKSGITFFSNIPVGSYKIVESKAPQGYVVSTVSISVVVQNNITKKVTFVNKKKDVGLPGTDIPQETGTSKIIINKININNKPLSGAEFTLYDSKGNIVSKVVSGADGQVVFSDLKPGSYQVQETKAPQGYALDTKKLDIKLDKKETLKLDFRNRRIEDLQDEEVPFGWVDDNKTDDNNDKSNNPQNDKKGKLPQAGEMMDTYMMLLLGAVLVITGTTQLIISRKRKFSKE